MDAQIQNQGGNSQQLQDEKDRKAVSAIESRAMERQAAEQGANPDADKAMVAADIANFKEIQNPAWQESAAVQMADNSRDYPEYKAALATSEPGVAEKVAALDAANTAKIEAKEERKAVEFAAMMQEREDKAKAWTPEEAAKQAQQDVAAYRDMPDTTEQGFMRGDMALNATANPAYKEALQKAAPELAEEVTGEKRETIALDPAALERVAAARARDSAQAREALGLNAIEPNIERQQQQLSAEEDAKRSAWVKKAEPVEPVATEKAAAPGNKVESDEIFTASKEDVKPVVPPDIEKQYLRVGDKFYHPKNTDLVAFEDKGNKLETKSNSEAIAESMVRIAEARGWDEIKVSGSEAFRKEVWLEAASRGMHVKGYSPSEQDKAELAKRGASVEANKVEQDNKPFRARENEADKTTATAKPADAPKAEAKAEPEKPDSPNKKLAQVFAAETAVDAVKKHPELAGAVAAVAAMDKKAEADGLTPEQRAVVAARVRQNVMNSIERGDMPQVTVKEEVEVKRDAKEEKEFTR